jgi:DNA topoisomerase VI subunit A
VSKDIQGYCTQRRIPIKFDNFKTLAKNGVAVVVIEKEGIPEVLAEHAAKHGVALVNTRGRLTRDGIAFIEEVKALGSIVMLFVDYDAVGQDILNAIKTKTPVIGVNKETIAWFQQNGFPNLINKMIDIMVVIFNLF